MIAEQTITPSAQKTPNFKPERRRNLIAGGRRMSYVDVGEGQTPCLFIHGLSSSADCWSEIIPVMATTRRTVAIDLPGFGESEGARSYDPVAVVEAIDEFCERLGLETIDIVGHSLGTLLGIEFAHRHPDRIRRLVLVGGPITSLLGLASAPIRTLRRRPRVANFLIEALTTGIRLPAGLRKFIARHPMLRSLVLKPYVFNPRQLEPRLAESMIAGAGARGLYPTLASCWRYIPEQAMASLRCPTLVVGGVKDNIAPIEDLEDFSARENVEKFVALESTGHLPMFERPDDFNREVLEFLA